MRLKIQKHYDNEVQVYGNSAKCTMPDLFVKNLEVQKIVQVLEKIVSQKKLKILEVGCGNGYTISKLQKFDAQITGIDSNINMIKHAKKRKLKNTHFLHDSILEPKLKAGTFDVIITERCLINFLNWHEQKKALRNIHKLLKKNGSYIMLEAFSDGLSQLNMARNSIGLEKIVPAWHNLYFEKRNLEKFLVHKFKNWENNAKKISYDNFLSSYYFGSRVLYPSLMKDKEIIYNNKFVEFFSYLPGYGNFSPIQLCVLLKN